jgi:hypothetical protein
LDLEFSTCDKFSQTPASREPSRDGYKNDPCGVRLGFEPHLPRKAIWFGFWNATIQFSKICPDRRGQLLEYMVDITRVSWSTIFKFVTADEVVGG